MKKLLLPFLLFFFSGAHACGQEFRYGVTVAGLLSSPRDYRTRAGFDAGLRGEYSFSGKANDWGLGVSLLLASKGWKDDVYDENGFRHDWNWNLYYLEIPVTARYVYHINGVAGVYAEAGPYLACGLWGGNTAGGIPEYESGDVFSNGTCNRFDWGVKTCVGGGDIALPGGHRLEPQPSQSRKELDIASTQGHIFFAGTGLDVLTQL